MVDKKNILRNLSSNSPDFNSIKREIIELYNRENSTKISLNVEQISIKDRKKIVLWLNKNHTDLACYIKDNNIRKFHFGADLSHKTIITQIECPICGVNYPRYIIPIRVVPQTYQVKNSKLKNAFKKVIREHEVFSNYKRELYQSNICLLILFIINKTSKDKDVDNMSKIFIDSLEGILFENDKQIDHLNVIKWKWSGSDSFILFAIQESSVGDHSNVLFENMFMGWTEEMIDLQQYISNKKNRKGK